jgi:hypothetical protein
MGGSSDGSPKWVRIFRIGPGLADRKSAATGGCQECEGQGWFRNQKNSLKAISRMSPPQAGHSSGNSSPSRAMSFAQACPGGVIRAGLLLRIRVAAAFRGVTAAPMPAGHGISPLADVTDSQCRDGPPEPVIRRKHPVITMPVLPRRRDEIDKVGGRLGHVPTVAGRAGRRGAGMGPASGRHEYTAVHSLRGGAVRSQPFRKARWQASKSRACRRGTARAARAACTVTTDQVRSTGRPAANSGGVS